MNKKIFEKIILGLLTIILIAYISLGLVFFNIFNISKKFLNKENIVEIIDKIDLISVLKEELTDEVESIELIKEELFDIGLTEEGINKFVNSTEVKLYSYDKFSNVFNKILNKGNIEYKITNEEIDNLVENNIETLTFNSNVDKDKLLNKIQDKVPNFVTNINKLLDKICEKLLTSELMQKYKSYVYSFVNILDILYSDFTFGIIIFVLITLILLLIFIRRSFIKSLKWLSISFFIPIVIFGIVSTILYSFIDIDNNLISNIIKVINNDLINGAIIYFIISCLLVIINIIICVIKKYKNKGMVLYE